MTTTPSWLEADLGIEGVHQSDHSCGGVISRHVQSESG